MADQRESNGIEAVMLRGSIWFLSVAVGILVAGVLPFFVFTEHWFLRSILLCVGVGDIVGFLVTLVIWRRNGPMVLGGAFAGSMALSTFLYLRMGQIILSASAKQCPVPDYPAAFQNLVPLANMLVYGLLLSLLATRTTQKLD